MIAKNLTKHHYLKKEFHSNLNMEVTTDMDCKLANRVWKNFEIKHLSKYHNLYIQSNTLLLADLFKSFQNTCIDIYKLDFTYFLSASGSAWQAVLKKTGVELELLADVHIY